VGHLRSTIHRDAGACAYLMESFGQHSRKYGKSHVGDWGTQFVPCSWPIWKSKVSTPEAELADLENF